MLTLEDLAATVALTAVVLVASLAGSPVAAARSPAEEAGPSAWGQTHGPTLRSDAWMKHSLIAIVLRHAR